MMVPPGVPFDDLSHLALPGGLPAPKVRRPPRHQPGERFLRGPIPWPWLTRAARLPGRALTVALALWFQAGLKKSDTVALSLSGLREELGVHRDAARRGLAALEAAGLVRVEHHPGRKPVVTILRCTS